jgi:hypothetical protein
MNRSRRACTAASCRRRCARRARRSPARASTARVVVLCVEGEHPAKVDGVELRPHVDRRGESHERPLGELLRARTPCPATGCPADGPVRGDHGALDVRQGQGVTVAAGIQGIDGVPHVPLPPRDVSPRRPQLARPPGQPVQTSREQGPGGERLPGLERVVGAPPDPAPAAIPSGALDEAEGPPRVVEVPAIAAGPVGVEERQPPPAIVVEPGARPWVALTRVGGIARYRPLGWIPVALGSAGEPPQRGSVPSARVGDRHGGERLELGHDSPQGDQWVLAGGVETFAVPAPAGIPPCRGLMDAPLREREEVAPRRVARVRPGLRAHGHEHQRDDESYSGETHRRLWAEHSCGAAGVLRAGASRPLPTLPLCRRPLVP